MCLLILGHPKPYPPDLRNQHLAPLVAEFSHREVANIKPFIDSSFSPGGLGMRSAPPVLKSSI